MTLDQASGQAAAGAPPRVLLALDIATRSGWAVARLDQPAAPLPLEAVAQGNKPKPLSGVRTFTAWSEDQGQLYAHFGGWLSDMIRVHRPHLFVFEAPLPGPAMQSGNTARRLLGMAAIAEFVAVRMGVPLVREAHVSHVKKHATGSGIAKKAAMLEACRARGWAVRDDNEADALWLADFALASLARGRAIVASPAFEVVR